MDDLTIYALGSVISGKNFFFDILNIKFTDLDGVKLFHQNQYSYKGKDYNYYIYFIIGSYENTKLVPAQMFACDAVILLANPLNKNEFLNVDKLISEISFIQPNTLIAVIMHNVFGELDNLPPNVQETAMLNGEMLCELENNYQIKLISLSYSLDELESLHMGDPTAQFKFFKLFNDTFYDIIHESIERHENPELKKPIRTLEF